MLVNEIQLPTELILSPTFGGPNLDELFVGSGTLPVDFISGMSLNRTLTPSAGSLFRITRLGAKGYAGNRFRS